MLRGTGRGETAGSLDIDWSWPSASWRSPGLPDPAFGDAIYWYQRRSFAPFQIPNGLAVIRQVARYAGLDSFRLLDGQPATVSVPLVEPPQTGNLNLDVRTTQFAALAADMGPNASLAGLGVSIFAVPHSPLYPDEPVETERELLLLSASTTSDLDLAKTYGQFLGPPCQVLLHTVFSFTHTSPTAYHHSLYI